jgi:hypothetical protein
MLNRDEANANARAESGSEGSDISSSGTHLEEDRGILEGDFDTEHITDNDDDGCPSFTHSTVSGSRRSSNSSTSFERYVGFRVQRILNCVLTLIITVHSVVGDKSLRNIKLRTFCPDPVDLALARIHNLLKRRVTIQRINAER